MSDINLEKVDFATRRDACFYELRRSVLGGRKFRGDSLIHAGGEKFKVDGPSDPRTDPWGAAMDQIAAMFSQRSLDMKLDVNETMLFATSLKYVVKEYMRTLYTPCPVRGWGLAMDTETPPGAKTVAIRRIEVMGQMARIAPQATDVKRATIQAQETTWPLAEYGDYVSWTFSDLESAIMSGTPLQSEMMAALLLLSEQLFDVNMTIGDADCGINGLYNNALIAPTAVVTGTWLTPATADQVHIDARVCIYAARSATGGFFTPDLLVVPDNRWECMGYRRANTDTTVKMMLEQEFPGILITPHVRANVLDVAGTGPRLLAGCRKAATCQLVEPLPFSPLSPELHGLEFRVYARQKLGGARMTHPMAWAYMDGI